MITLPGYSISETLQNTNSSHLVRAIRLVDERPVILKIFRDALIPELTEKRKQEFGLHQRIGSNALVQAYSLEHHDGHDVLVLEDFGGEVLAQMGRCTLSTVLHLGIAIATCLHELHQAGVIHLGINPSNIVWNQATGIVKLIDVGLAITRREESLVATSPVQDESTTVYMSPEQTGWIDQNIDHRSDYYSFGVTLYELLSGQLPFTQSDSAAAILVGRGQQSILEPIIPGIPVMVSIIVMKMMAKIPKDRYQSILGVKADLQRCLETLRNGSDTIAPFELGASDFSTPLELPQKLNGRSEELETLQAAYEQARQGSSPILLITGQAGVGKTVLVSKFESSLRGTGNYFIKGKFDQFKRNVPYSSLSQAFTEFLQSLLTQENAALDRWRIALQAAVGEDGAVITEVLPVLESIIGVQPKLADFPQEHMRHRFNKVFRAFTSVFATPATPLVLFFDDLQWADLPSLQLIVSLVDRPALPHLLIIGAHRDGEVEYQAPIARLREELARKTIQLPTVALQPLSESHIARFLADSMQMTANESAAFAHLCMKRTLGNPFFLTHFLRDLESKMLLNVDPISGKWQWDLTAIQESDYIDNVIDLMLIRLRKLPLETQHVLQSAAGLGVSFDIDMLATIVHTTEINALELVRPAEHDGLIVRTEQNAFAVRGDTERSDQRMDNVTFRFLHDRVQQAAYQLRSPEERMETHLDIGRLWLAKLQKSGQHDLVFDVVNHLNLARQLIVGFDERLHAAKMNLVAAQKARSTTAYKPALLYMEAAVEFLGDAGWERDKKFTLEVYLAAADIAYLSGVYTAVEGYTRAYIEHAPDSLAKASAFEIDILTELVQGKFREAVIHGLTILAMLDMHFPKKPNRFGNWFRKHNTAMRFRWSTSDSLASLPAMTDKKALAISRILAIIISPAYRSMPKLRPHLVFESVLLAKKYGNAPTTGYINYALLLVGNYGEVEKGNQFARLAIRLVERQPLNIDAARVRHLQLQLIAPWQTPIRELIGPLFENYQYALRFGMLDWGASSLYWTLEFGLETGQNLNELERIAHENAFLTQSRLGPTYYAYSAFRQTLINLTAPVDSPAHLMGKFFNAEHHTAVELLMNDASLQSVVTSKRLFVAYLFQDYDLALCQAKIGDDLTPAVPGVYWNAIICFYGVLTNLKFLPKASANMRRRLLSDIKAKQKQLRIWGDRSPTTFIHKWHLVEAEILHHTGQHQAAAKQYDKAIAIAKEQEFLSDEALAYELCGEFYLDTGQDLIAKTYLREAQSLYRRWGANAKVEHLARCHPQLLSQEMKRSDAVNLDDETSLSTVASVKRVEVPAISKAPQVLPH